MPVDARKLEQIKQLIELAQHEGTLESEARNAAFMAVRLMGKHGLTVAAPMELYNQAWQGSVHRSPERPAPPSAAPPRAKPAPAKPYRKLKSKYGWRCSACSVDFEGGSWMWWRGGTPNPCLCDGCHREPSPTA